MAKVVRIRRGTEAENNAFTGLQSEITHDTTNNSLRVHDGTTQGGTTLLNHKLLVSELLDLIYPIGAIYMSTNSSSPATFLGGTWEQIQGKFLLAASADHEAGSTGGSETHTITESEMPSHTHTGTTASAGSHSHTRGSMDIVGSALAIPALSYSYSGALYETEGVAAEIKIDGGNSTYGRMHLGFQASKGWTGSTSSDGAHTHTFTSASTGGGTAMSIMNPYLAVYVWKRTA